MHNYTYCIRVQVISWYGLACTRIKYLALVLPGCHFLNIFASKVSRKNKGKVSQIFGQSVTNDTSTPGWVPLAYSTLLKWTCMSTCTTCFRVILVILRVWMNNTNFRVPLWNWTLVILCEYLKNYKGQN